jgi:hypothetical protein
MTLTKQQVREVLDVYIRVWEDQAPARHIICPAQRATPAIERCLRLCRRADLPSDWVGASSSASYRMLGGVGELRFLDHRAPPADPVSGPQQRALSAAALGPAGKASLDLRSAPQHPENLNRVLALVRIGQLHGIQFTGALDPTKPIVGNRRKLPPQAAVPHFRRVGPLRIRRVELLKGQLLLHGAAFLRELDDRSWLLPCRSGTSLPWPGSNCAVMAVTVEVEHRYSQRAGPANGLNPLGLPDGP